MDSGNYTDTEDIFKLVCKMKRLFQQLFIAAGMFAVVYFGLTSVGGVSQRNAQIAGGVVAGVFLLAPLVLRS